MKKIDNYIHGKIVKSQSTKELPVFDPSTGEECCKVALSNKADFEKIIESSKSGFNEWSKLTPLKRSRVLSKYKELIEKNIDEIASLISKEHYHHELQ